MPMPFSMIVVVVVALQMSACGSGSQSTTEQDRRAEEYARSFGANVDVQTNADGTRSVTVDRSTAGVTAQAGSNLSVPAGFPDDVPLYPQLKLISANQMPGMAMMIQGQTPDAPDKVSAFYSSQMVTNGWTVDASQDSAALRVLQFKKGERMAGVMVIPGQAGTTVQVTVAGAP